MTATVPQRVRVAGDLFHGRVPAGAVYVGRVAPGLPTSPYANPHLVGDCRYCGRRHDQDGAADAYLHHLAKWPALVQAARRDLAGRDLACWCHTGLRCHADVLLSFVNAGVARSAVVSPCGTYRYELRRVWAAGPLCGWIMLNPSTADAEQDDPTIRRCMGFARAWGYAGIVVRNLYALRATDPRELATHPQPWGPDNDTHLMNAVDDPITVCAWGSRGERGDTVINALADAGANLHHLGLTRAGKPRHPLYRPASVTPTPFARGSR
jgi:hypothetical protein